MSNILLTILPMIEPQLDKVPQGLAEIDTKYGVKDAMWLIRRRYDEKVGKEVASLEFMCTQEFDKPDGTKGYRMVSIKDPKTGEPIRYGLASLIAMLTGSSLEEED